MKGLFGYAALAIVPIIAAPIQLLYLNAGRRYDVGMVLVVATGAYATICVRTPGPGSNLIAVTVLLGTATILASAARVLALTLADPASFTLLSLGQMWATAAIIDFAAGPNSIDTNSPFSASYIAFGGVLWCMAAAYLIQQATWPIRMRALTDSPEQYSLLLGSRLRFAILVELTALVTYLAAGVAISLCFQSVSAAEFTEEAIWVVLSVALVPRYRWYLVWIGPLVLVAVRWTINSLVAPRLAAITAYFLLAILLAGSVVIAAHRDRGQRV